MSQRTLNNPTFLILISFASVIICGTLLLMLPIATHSGISMINALFTSTSAVCVTGLIVKSTGNDFTIFGQIVIMTMIQIGGLGILTLSAFFMGILSGKIGLRERAWVEESLTQIPIGDFYSFLKRTIVFVAGFEITGAVLLFIFFIRKYSFGRSIMLSVFHSISAFCNAGFSLFDSSFIDYKDSIYVNLIIIGLIVFGGIGFLVMEDILSFLKDIKHKFSFHTKIVLWTTILLIIFGSILIFLLESNSSLKSCNGITKIVVSFFQSITCRTAGFNTINIKILRPSTLFFMIMLMFIGGSPGSTAGGIKTTSFALFISLIISRLRGRSKPELFKRTVSKETVNKVLTLILVSILILIVCIFILLITERNNFDSQHGYSFLGIIFESVSAFGTVGLSLGITPYLTVFGKIVIIFLMYIGRTGPLTLALIMSGKQEELKFDYPEDDILIG